MRAITVVLVLAAICWSVPVFATTTTITIDENDPTVSLPFPVTSGIVRINEPNGALSDFLSFTGPSVGSTQSSILYCSDNSDGTDLTADFVPFDACGSLVFGMFGVRTAVLVEPPEGANEVITYTPLPGQPGFSDPVTYIIQGDTAVTTTPEPGTLLLVGTGLLGVVGAVRRKWLHA